MSEQKKCSSCNKVFSCENSLSCWCSEFPPILKVEETANCLCPSCLHALVREKTVEFVAQWKKEGMVLEPPQLTCQALVEGIDFYKEGGLYVFTEWFHVKRGTCCGNGCRHCPYLS